MAIHPNQIDPDLLALAGMVNGEVNTLKKNSDGVGTGLSPGSPRLPPIAIPNLPLPPEVTSKLIPDVPIELPVNNRILQQPPVINTQIQQPTNVQYTQNNEQPLNIHLAIWDKLGKIESKLNEIDEKLTKKKKKKIKKNVKSVILKEISNESNDQKIT